MSGLTLDEQITLVRTYFHRVDTGAGFTWG